MTDKEVGDIKVELAEFKGRVLEWMSGTTEYRKKLCDKIDIITEKLNKLPCDGRVEPFKSALLQIKAIWAFIGAIVLAVVVDYIRSK